MPLTSLTKLQGASFGNVTATSVTSNTVVVSNTSMTQVYAVTLTAGETLAALDAVYLEPTLTQGTAGRVYKMDADVLVKSTQAMFVGFALAASSAAANVNIQISGVVSGFSGLTTGAMYYASSTAGAITATKPLHPLPVGIAISTTQLLINTRKREQEESENVSAIYGYFLNGAADIGGTVSAIADRITFSTGTTSASTNSKLSSSRFGGASISDCTVYGYTLGGYIAADTNIVDRTIFATSVTSVASVTLSAARRGIAGVSDGAVYGYALGGAGYVATADIVTFGTGTVDALTTANLSLARRVDTGGLSDATTYGYVLGGFSGAAVATADRITFSTRTTAASTTSNLSQARMYVTAVSDGATYGYSLGGDTVSGAAVVATADRTTFSTSATAAYTAANLSAARSGPSGVSDGAIYGYVAGGYNSVTNLTVTTADRITFSSGATAAYTGAALSAARWLGHAFSDGAV